MEMYQQKKKKREVDPNAPPRPTLLGHEKEMKVWRNQFEKLASTNTEQAITIATLERKLNRLQSQVDAMTSFINRKIR
jgi:predicted RNase H-like nuclease (RuvC/YqgF family)